MTLSIVAKDEKTGDFGVCGYTDIAGYGSLVPHISLNGAIATQAYVNDDNGIEILELLEKNISISEAGNKVINKDNDKSMRQLIGIGKNNEVFEWTGKNTLDYKNSIIKDNFVVAGNCMESFNVIKSVADYYLSNLNQDFAKRLIKAIQAGESEGGHIKKINYVDPITKNKITNTYLLKAIHMAQKAKQYFRLLKTVVFLNIDYKKDLLVKQLYLVLSKNWQQVKAMLINKKCMRHLQKHKALI